MAMRIRKNKPQRYNPFAEQLLKKEFMDQMKVLAQQHNESLESNDTETAVDISVDTVNTNSNINEGDNEPRTS